MSIDFPPDDLTLSVRRWLATEVYPGLLGEPFDDRAAAVWLDGSQGFVSLWVGGYGNTLPPLERLEFIKHELYRRIDAVKRAGHPPDPVPSPYPSAGFVPIVGTVELVDGGRGGLKDATGRRLFQGCHAGDLLSRYYRDADTARRALDTIAAAGCQFVRTWTVLPGPWWGARTGEFHPGLPGYWETVRAFARELVARGLWWQVSQGDMMRYYPGREERRHFMRSLAQTLKEEGGTERLVISVDAGNESWNGNGEDDPLKMADCLSAFLAVLPVPLSALTSAHDEGVLNEYAIEPASVIAYHQSRMAFRHAIERAFTASYWDGKDRHYLMDDEPAGVNNADPGDRPGGHVSATQNPAEWRELECMGMNAVVHLVTRQLYTFMSSPGVISDEPFENYPAMALAPKIAALLPADIQSWRLFHGGEGRPFSPERVFAVSGDNVRCDHAKAVDGRVAVMVYVDEPCHLDLLAINGFEGEVIHPGTLDRAPMSFTAGQRVPMDLRRGRLLLGRYS